MGEEIQAINIEKNIMIITQIVYLILSYQNQHQLEFILVFVINYFNSSVSVMFSSESGYILRNLGCNNLVTLSSTPGLTRHQCGLSCLGLSDCVSFAYHYLTVPPTCKLHSNTCKVSTVIDIHTYDKGRCSGRV